MYYQQILMIHSLIRWIFLAYLIYVLIQYIFQKFQNRENPAPFQRQSIYVLLLFIFQLLTGMVLYLFLSPITQTAFLDFGAAMKIPEIRFYAVEHIFIMLLSGIPLFIATLISRANRPVTKTRNILILLYLLTLLLVLAGIPWNRF